MVKVKLFIVLALLWAFYGCNTSSDEEPVVENLYLVESSEKGDFDKSLIQNLAVFSGLSELDQYIRYGIDIYRITYRTTVQGQPTIASGVISIPKDLPGPLPLIAAHRGTILSDTEAPSETDLIYGFEVFAAAGYVTLLPDMIGFGESKDMIQYYYNKETNSQVAIDMIKASKEFLDEIDVLTNDDLFLLGYSQGGSVTMAVQDWLENDPAIGMKVTAVASGAGAYDIEFVMDDVINRNEFDSPAFLALIVYSYNEVNGFGRSMNDYFASPYAEAIPDLLDGSNTLEEVDNNLTDIVSELFQPTFVEGLKNGSEVQMLDAFMVNSTDQFTPVAPVRIYHSEGDELIPIEDSRATAMKFAESGSDVQFISLRNRSHGVSSIDMIIEVAPWFESLRTDQ